MRNLRFRAILVIVITVFLIVASFNFMPSFAQSSPYPDYPTFIANFEALATSYPQFVSYQTIGKSVLGQNIIMFKIGNPSGGVVLFDGAIHGYENEGSQLLYYYALWLLTSNDPLAQYTLANTCTLMVPVVNVDDYGLNRTNAHGVDLNRNFETDWIDAGSSDPTSDTYRGPSPLSEPESQALEGVFLNYRPYAYINLHDADGEEFYESSYTNSTYVNTVVEKINSLNLQRGVTPYPLESIISFPGAAMTDAVTKGGAQISFLLELGNATRTLSEVESLVLHMFIPYAVVLSQESDENAQAVQNTTLFSDSFESGTFGSWDGTSITTGETMSISDLLARDGTHSAFFSADGTQASGNAYAYENLPSETSLYERGYIMPASFVQTGSYSRYYFAAFAASGQTIVMAGIITNGTTTTWRLAAEIGTNWIIVDSSIAADISLWHSFELQWSEGSANGYAYLYIDNALVCSISGANTTVYGAANSVQNGIVLSGNANTTLYLDYIQVSTTSLGPLPIPADINQDGIVDMHDVAIVARALGATPGSANWNPRADLDGNSKIDMNDLAIVVRQLGETLPKSFSTS